jgi:plasmid stabilization system protein ParE
MIVEPEAGQELLAAAAWYDDQRPALGDEFLSAIDEVLERVAAAPLSYPRDRSDERARRALVARFPFAVAFVVRDAELRVVAFVHAKRLPGYWTKRVQPRYLSWLLPSSITRSPWTSGQNKPFLIALGFGLIARCSASSATLVRRESGTLARARSDDELMT